jgi:hypothetical protein
MKREHLGWLTAAGILLLCCLMGAGGFDQVGRWQIASVHIHHELGERTVLLDTATGKMKWLRMRNMNDNSGEWIERDFYGLK